MYAFFLGENSQEQGLKTKLKTLRKRYVYNYLLPLYITQNVLNACAS